VAKSAAGKKPKPRGRGRPPFRPTPEQRELVENCVSRGIPEADLVTRIRNPATGAPVDLKTYRKHFRAEIDRGKQQIDDRVANYIASWATGRRGHNDTALRAAIYWSKARMSWRDGQNGGNGGGSSGGGGGPGGNDEIVVVGGLPGRKRE
jgi:hypothetical protein